jgi:hypothetical protein
MPAPGNSPHLSSGHGSIPEVKRLSPQHAEQKKVLLNALRCHILPSGAKNSAARHSSYLE